MTGTSSRRGLNIALLVASGFLSLIFGEAALRLLGRGPLQVNPVPGSFWRHDAHLGWSNAPGADGVFDHPRFRINVKINSKGLRDREYAYERTPGKRRILVIGDSFVWGYGVEQPETFAKVLEAQRAELEAINAGVAGYGTDQELLWLRSEGLRYRPDVVILVMCGNDDDENNKDLVYNVYHKPRFRLTGGELTLSGVPVPEPSARLRAKHWIFAHSALAYQLKSGVIDRFRRPRSTAPPSGGLELTFALVDAIAREVRGSGARLVLVTTARYAPSPRFPYDEFLAGLRRRGLTILDVDHTPGYSEATMLIAGDAHWNPAGHRFVAQQLLALLQEQQLLDEPLGRVPVRNQGPSGLTATPTTLQLPVPGLKLDRMAPDDRSKR